MEPVEAQISVYLLQKLLLTLCRLSEDASASRTKWGSQRLREMWIIWGQNALGWWPGLTGQDELRGSSRQKLRHSLFQSAISRPLCSGRFNSDSCRGCVSSAFTEVTFIQTTQKDDKYHCDYSHTPVWLAHLLLGCFHVEIFIIMTFPVWHFKISSLSLFICYISVTQISHVRIVLT